MLLTMDPSMHAGFCECDGCELEEQKRQEFCWVLFNLYGKNKSLQHCGNTRLLPQPSFSDMTFAHMNENTSNASSMVNFRFQPSCVCRLQVCPSTNPILTSQNGGSRCGNGGVGQTPRLRFEMASQMEIQGFMGIVF